MTDIIPKRDPQRSFPEDLRRTIHANQGGACKVCSTELPQDFHVHHRIPWALGGPTILSNGVAVCPGCHRYAEISPFEGLTLRAWQVDALKVVLPKLLAGQFATVAAAPGAGKTLFTAKVIQEMLARSAADRVSVIVPNGNLRKQWQTELARIGLHVQPDPRYLREKDGYQGNVLTYGKVAANVANLRQIPGRTLFVLDEVHHLGRDASGESKSWAHAIGNIVGTVDSPIHPVLNLTGTPFRSVQGERIGTCAYRDAGGDKIELVTDFKISSAKLISDAYLRHVQIHVFDAGLSILNLKDGDVADARVVDLDQVPSSTRSAALKRLISDEVGFIRPVLTHLRNTLAMQQEALRGHPLKGLVICDDQKQADTVHQIAQQHLGMPAEAVLKAVSDEGRDAAAAIEAFRTSKSPAILVAVRMVSEGFDAPDVSAIAYLSSWTAPLFLTQMVARAMRVTPTEREHGRIPAEVIIPGDPAMVDAFRQVLSEEMRLLEVPAGDCPRCKRAAGACYCNTPIVDKMCYVCNLPRKICPCEKVPGGAPPPPAIQVDVTDEAAFTALHRDGEEVNSDLMDLLRREAGIEFDPVHIPGVALLLQKTIKNNPYALGEYMKGRDAG